ncbi:MAG: pteridine reductase [Gammaproteobacteria bacterium]
MTPTPAPTLSLYSRVILITGAARRLGAAMASHLHADGAKIVVHYRNSSDDADALVDSLNALRRDSAKSVQADLSDPDAIEPLAKAAIEAFGQIDILVNNASSFYPTPVGTVTASQWDDLMASNLRAPFFLSQALSSELRLRKGAILNMVDIHASRPLADHPVYCAAKAGLVMLTQSLAKDLGPDVRVNAIAPGPVMWPENDMDESSKTAIVDSTLLQRSGNPDDIARAARFLLRDATFTTGQILAIDGGRSLRD